MELFTRSYNKQWNRIVYLYMNRQDDMFTHINDPETCKLVLIKKGNKEVLCNRKKIYVIAPALLFFTHEDEVEHGDENVIDCDVIYFRPEVINDGLQYDRLKDISDYEGSISTLQDRYLLNAFYEFGKAITKIMLIEAGSLMNIQDLFVHIEKELKEQKDSFWPCRSRSFFLELLFYIDRYRHSNFMEPDLSYATLSQKESFELVQKILVYLNEHISEKITLAELTKRFGINRNRLNEIFMESTGQTTMQYLIQMRLKLSTLMLKDTEIPIQEIAYRVGFKDTSYFSKTFKASFSYTPSQYRKVMR